MAKYSKRPDGRYVANRTINGKRKVFYGKTCKEIDQKIAAYMAERQDGRLFKAVAEEWWAIKQGEIRKSSANAYTPAFKRVVAAFGGRRITSIKPPEINAYMMDFAREGYHKSSGNTERTVLKQIFEFAVNAGEIEYSPAAVVKVPKFMPTDVVPPLTAEQEKRAFAYKDGPAGLLVQTLIYTGLRFGELAGLTYADIDRKRGYISINKKINYTDGNRGELENHLKTENGLRELPLMAPLAKQLPANRIGYVFPGDDGGWSMANRLRGLWAKFCTDTGMVDEDGEPAIHPHQMRHTYATILYERGVDIKTAAAWMGDTEEVVAKVYQSLRPKQIDDAKEKVEAYYRELGEA